VERSGIPPVQSDQPEFGGDAATDVGFAVAPFGRTGTATRLEVTAEWLENSYRRGVVVSDAEVAELNIEHHSTCPKWNYTIKPRGIQ
jgi:hypothetical protein